MRPPMEHMFDSAKNAPRYRSKRQSSVTFMGSLTGGYYFLANVLQSSSPKSTVRRSPSRE